MNRFLITAILAATPALGFADDWTPDAAPATVPGVAGTTERIFNGTCADWTFSDAMRLEAEKDAESNAVHSCFGVAAKRTGDWSFKQECFGSIYVRWLLSAWFDCGERQLEADLSGENAKALAKQINSSVKVLCGETLKEVVVDGHLRNYKEYYECTLRDAAGVDRVIVDEQADDGQTWAKQEGAVSLYDALPVYEMSRTDRFIGRKLATVECHEYQGAPTCKVEGFIDRREL